MIINKKLVEVIVDLVGVNPSSVVEGAHLEDDLGFDELDRIEVAMSVEDELAIEIPDEKLENFKTVGDFQNFLTTLGH